MSLSSEKLSVVQQQDLLLWWGRDGLQTSFQNHLKTFCISIWKPLDVYFSADPFNPCRIINLPRRLPRTPWRIRKASVFRFPISDKQVSHFQLSPLLHHNHFSKLDFARKKSVPSHLAILCWYWMMMSADPPGAHNALRDLPWITYTGAISPYCSIVILDYATRHFFDYNNDDDVDNFKKLLGVNKCRRWTQVGETGWMESWRGEAKGN